MVIQLQIILVMIIAVDELPELDINSSTGFGAIINPEIDIRPDDDGEVKQVIDCIT